MAAVGVAVHGQAFVLELVLQRQGAIQVIGRSIQVAPFDFQVGGFIQRIEEAVLAVSGGGQRDGLADVFRCCSQVAFTQ